MANPNLTNGMYKPTNGRLNESKEKRKDSNMIIMYTDKRQNRKDHSKVILNYLNV